MAQLDISSKNRKTLRGMAHALQPTVQVGQEGVTAGVVAALDAALLAHELVKVRMREPNDKKAWAAQLADATGAALCGLVGHTVILYRPHPEKPKIQLDTQTPA